MREVIVKACNDQGYRAALNSKHVLLFQYLRQSISYKLALDYIKNGVIDDEMARIPDFDRVIQVAYDFGDVHHCYLDQWMNTHCCVAFGIVDDNPQPRVLINARPNFPNLAEKLAEVISHFYPNGKTAQQPNFYVEIPQTITREEMITFVTGLLKRAQNRGVKRTYGINAKYKLEINKINEATLDKGHEFLNLYQNTNLSMWRIGSKINLSPKLNETVDPDAKRQSEIQTSANRILSIMTNRLMKKSILIAENAARGRFPCIEPLPYVPLYRPK